MKLAAVVCSLLCSAVHGAITLLPAPNTTWSTTQAPYPSRVVSETETVVSLDDRSGLTIGLPIRITVPGGENFAWLIGFCSSQGLLQFTSQASVRLIVGEYSAQIASTIYESLNFVPFGQVSSCPVAFLLGPTIPSLEITVPWDAELSQARFVISQDSIVSGSNASFSTSAIHMFSLGPDGRVIPSIVQLTSVPEPGLALLLCLPSALLLRWRWRRADAVSAWAG